MSLYVCKDPCTDKEKLAVNKLTVHSNMLQIFPFRITHLRNCPKILQSKDTRIFHQSSLLKLSKTELRKSWTDIKITSHGKKNMQQKTKKMNWTSSLKSQKQTFCTKVVVLNASTLKLLILKRLVMRSGGEGSFCAKTWPSVVPAGVNSVPQYRDNGQVVSDSGVVLNVIEPSCHVGKLLLLLDSQIHLGGRGLGQLVIWKPAYPVCTRNQELYELRHLF